MNRIIVKGLIFGGLCIYLLLSAYQKEFKKIDKDLKSDSNKTYSLRLMCINNERDCKKLLAERDYDEVIRLCTRVLDKIDGRGNDFAKDKSKTYFLRGEAYFRKHDLKNAIPQFQYSLIFDKNSPAGKHRNLFSKYGLPELNQKFK